MSDATFSLLRYTPAPEYIDAVNVAILILDGRPRLISDSAFPKLSCAAPKCNLETLQFWLECLDEEVRQCDSNEVPGLLRSKSAQIKLSPPRILTRRVDRDFEKHLIDVYLKRATRVHAHHDRKPYVDALLDTVVHEDLGLRNFKMLRRAHPQDFLSPESCKLLKSTDFKISRVISGERKLILMDGLNLEGISSAHLRSRAQEIGSSFYAMRRVKSELPKIEGRELIRASFVFNAARATLDLKTEYAVEALQRHSDISIDPASVDDQRRLKDLVLQAGQDDISLEA